MCSSTITRSPTTSGTPSCVRSPTGSASGTWTASDVSGTPALPPQRDFVDGAWIDPPLDGVALVHPDTGAELARSATSTMETVDRAIAAAARDHTEGGWAERSIEDRAALLHALAHRLDALAE